MTENAPFASELMHRKPKLSIYLKYGYWFLTLRKRCVKMLKGSYVCPYHFSLDVKLKKADLCFKNPRASAAGN